MLPGVSPETSLARSIIPRALSSRATRVLRLALRRLPPRVQQFGLRAMNPVVKRWPTVAALLGLAPDDRGPPSSQMVDFGRIARDVSPSSSNAASASDVRAWLTALATSTEMALRIKAVRALAEAAFPPVTAALCAALRDPSAEVAAEAAHALRHHREQDAIAALSRVVENADGYFSGGVRAAAIRTLSAILPHGRGQAIVAAVADRDAEVSVAAIAGVVDRNEAGGGDALLTVLENPHGYYVSLTRGAAARGMRRLVTPPDAARVRALLAAEEDRNISDVLRGLLDEGRG
jgi:HEAT repeat protein